MKREVERRIGLIPDHHYDLREWLIDRLYDRIQEEARITTALLEVQDCQEVYEIDSEEEKLLAFRSQESDRKFRQDLRDKIKEDPKNDLRKLWLLNVEANYQDEVVEDFREEGFNTYEACVLVVASGYQQAYGQTRPYDYYVGGCEGVIERSYERYCNAMPEKEYEGW